MTKIEDILKISVTSGITKSERKYLHGMIVKYKPEYVVETGSGASTLSILAGLEKNQHGQLCSIDLPDLENRPIKNIWQEMAHEHSNWTIHEEDITLVLPSIVQRMSRIDFFLHDSLHTSEHVEFELKAVLPKMVKGGIVGMHDIYHEDMLAIVAQMNADEHFRFMGRKRHLGFWQRNSC